MGATQRGTVAAQPEVAMSRRLAVPLVAALAFSLACSGENPVAPAGDPALTASRFRAQVKDLIVYTQNVYVGTDVDAVLSSPPEELQQRLITAIGTFLATDWPQRAEAIADEIRRERPDLVSLNEISHVTITGLGAMGLPDIDVDFLPILQAALDARRLPYTVAGVSPNIDANLSLGGAAVRLQDFDVVLARKGVAISNVSAANYAARVTADLGPLGSVELIRGRVMLDASEGGRTVRFVSTHFEPEETSLELQLGQSGELLAQLADSPWPVVIAGDLNSDPAGPNPVTTYTTLRDAGFQDAWLQSPMSRFSNGFTCCRAADLVSADPTLRKRIDLVMVRPNGRHHHFGLRPVRATLFGDTGMEKTSGGLWPSDHLGVVVTLRWDRLGGR